MSSFDKLSVWPVGYFRAYSSWLLRNRRDVSARIATLNAELERIGQLKVTYLSTEVEGQPRKTEERVGISVTHNSSLGRLLQAYVANGGNPLDISSFMYPDCVEVLEAEDGEPTKTSEVYPHAGVYAPQSANPNEPTQSGEKTGYGPYQGGFIRSDRYFPARQGGRMSAGTFDSDSIVRTMHQIRSWANQEIKERLQDIEWRIVKLADLREQLTQERDEVLAQAFGGSLDCMGSIDTSRIDPGLLMQNLVQDLYNLIYETDATGKVTSLKANSNVGFLKFTFPDLPSELRDPLGC